MEYYDKAIASKNLLYIYQNCYNIGKYIILFFTSFRCMIFIFNTAVVFLVGYRVILDR